MASKSVKRNVNRHEQTDRHRIKNSVFNWRYLIIGSQQQVLFNVRAAHGNQFHPFFLFLRKSKHPTTKDYTTIAAFFLETPENTRDENKH